jgi:hypothetical protein
MPAIAKTPGPPPEMPHSVAHVGPPEDPVSLGAGHAATEAGAYGNSGRGGEIGGLVATRVSPPGATQGKRQIQNMFSPYMRLQHMKMHNYTFGYAI